MIWSSCVVNVDMTDVYYSQRKSGELSINVCAESIKVHILSCLVYIGPHGIK